jgi:hypothetical protein
MERWKPIPGTKERLYVSDYGRVKSFLRNKTEGNILKPTRDHKGYLRLHVTLDGLRCSYKIHRLVASAFIENPENKAQVNHKDGNTKNNHIENLEWVTAKENVEHASKVLNVLSAYKIANNNKKKKIKQIDIITGCVIKIFDSIRQASEETKIPASNIVAVLKGRQKRTYEYSWCYVEKVEG